MDPNGTECDLHRKRRLARQPPSQREKEKPTDKRRRGNQIRGDTKANRFDQANRLMMLAATP